jgi:serine/threonine protein phosphatase PrpC
MVICSDGIWEFLKNEKIMNIGNDFYDNNNSDVYINYISICPNNSIKNLVCIISKKYREVEEITKIFEHS